METTGGLTVRDVGDDRREEYRRFVSEHPTRTAFHGLPWRRAVERAFGYEPAYSLLFDESDDDPVAAVPGFRVPGLVGTCLKNPFSEYGYPLIAERASPEAVLRSLADVPGRTNARILKEASFSGVNGYGPAGFGAVRTGVAYRLALDPGFEWLRDSAFESELRRTVRQADETGLTLSASEDVDAFYDLYVDTMRRLGSPQFPRAFFEALRSAFGSDCRLWLVEDGAPIAGVLALQCNGTCHLFANGSDADRLGARPNHFLYAKVIERLAEEGQSVVDFGRSEPGSGVAAFKELFGATPHRLASFVAPPRFVGRADVSGLKRLAPLARLAAPAITHPAVGPRLKELVAE